MIVFFVLVVSIFAVLGYKYMHEHPMAFALFNQAKVVENEDDNKITLPVSLTSQNINNVYLGYNFFGRVKEIKNVNDALPSSFRLRLQDDAARQL